MPGSGRVVVVEPSEVLSDHLDQVVTATGLLDGLIAESLANLRPAITVPQWRVLVLASEGTCDVSAVAADLAVHISNATRTCDRLVTAGLLERRRAEHDKRYVLIALTPAGRRSFDRALDCRRHRLKQALVQLTEDERADLAKCVTRLVQAANESKLTKRAEG